MLVRYSGINFLVILLLLIGLVSCSTEKKVDIYNSIIDDDVISSLPSQSISYQETIKPILARRCIVCHSCYDAPCQLKLTSQDGIQRGATKVNLYDSRRLNSIELTRLNIDAQSINQWRDKNFFPIIKDTNQSLPIKIKLAENNLNQSLLYQMLKLKQLNPQLKDGLLHPTIENIINGSYQCPDRSEFSCEVVLSSIFAWPMPQVQ